MYTRFEDPETLISILNSCQQLERIGVYCARLRAIEVLEIIAKYSTKNFHKLELYEINLFLEELETFFMI